jgi:hypothetical protein
MIVHLNFGPKQTLFLLLWELREVMLSFQKMRLTIMYKMQMQGQIEAKSSRLIVDEGGEMNVENGAVFVDNGANHAGIICPNFIGCSSTSSW